MIITKQTAITVFDFLLHIPDIHVVNNPADGIYIIYDIRDKLIRFVRPQRMFCTMISVALPDEYLAIEPKTYHIPEKDIEFVRANLNDMGDDIPTNFWCGIVIDRMTHEPTYPFWQLSDLSFGDRESTNVEVNLQSLNLIYGAFCGLRRTSKLTDPKFTALSFESKASGFFLNDTHRVSRVTIPEFLNNHDTLRSPIIYFSNIHSTANAEYVNYNMIKSEL